MKVNKNVSSDWFDMQSTDYVGVFKKYVNDTLSGYYASITKREPFEIVYLCDWSAPKTLENEQIADISKKRVIGEVPRPQSAS